MQESLNEMNEELQENARETELELREERDNALVRLSEVCGSVRFHFSLLF